MPTYLLWDDLDYLKAIAVSRPSAASTLLAGFASMLIRFHSPASRAQMAAYLADSLVSGGSALPAAIANQIIAGVGNPSPSTVEAALNAAAEAKETADANEREKILQLARLWKKTNPAR